MEKKMRINKYFMACLVLLLVLLLGVSVAGVTAQAVHLRGTVWVDPQELDALGKLTEIYTADHPDVEVEWVNIVDGGPYGRDKLQTMLAGGDIPDFMMLNTGQFEALAARDQLLPLDDLAASSNLDLSIYWPQAITGSKYQGILYALPRDMSNVILYYNKDLFDAAGVAYPTDDWTWNDLLTAAQALTLDKNGDGQPDQWGMAVANVSWQWDGFVLGNGGKVLSDDRTTCTFTDPKTLDALEFWFGMLTDQKVSPPPGALPNMAWSGDWFTNQAVAMGLFGPWFRPTLVGLDAATQFKWDVAKPPKSPTTGERGSDVYVDQWAIAAGSKLPGETFDFVTFLTSKAGQERWTALLGARSISPVQEVAQSDAWLSYGGSSGQIILDSLSFSQPPPVNFGNAPEAENLWTQEFDLVVSGDESVADAATNVCSQLEGVLPTGS
jgi:ABC-type glycerol-3-phosphate transport system substrate-binding protein